MNRSAYIKTSLKMREGKINNKLAILMLCTLISAVLMTATRISPASAAAVINVPGDHATIQAAINAATSGDTIIVAAGSYAGAVVNKSLTIQGAYGGASIITSGVHYGGSHPTAATAFRLDSGSDGTTIRDFTIDCDVGSSFYFAVFSRNISDVVIDAFIIHGTVQGISNYGGSNWEITNCVFNGTEAAGGGGIGILLGIYPPDYTVCSGNLVQNNTFWSNASAPDYSTPAIVLDLDLRYDRYPLLTGNEDLSNNQIIGNHIESLGYPFGTGIEMGVIGLEENATRIAATLGIINDNTIQDNRINGTYTGLYLYTISNTTVTRNDISNCDDAIFVADGIADNQIHYNNIYDNTVGLNNTVSTSIDARFNWWGDATGPYHPIQNPDGLGDEVSDNVTFSGYLTELFTTLLYTDPDLVQKTHSDVSTYFNVSVIIENATDLFGFDLNITWDNMLIVFNEAFYNTTLDSLWGPGNWYVVKNETGTGWFKLVAISTATGFNGDATLFSIEFHVETGCNFLLETPIHFEVVKLSNSYWIPIPAFVDDGLYRMLATVPDLEFILVGTMPFEYCDTFSVEVWVIDICANLKDYNITILYDEELLALVSVDWMGGVLGNDTDNAAYQLLSPNKVQVWDTGGLAFDSGDGLLFTLSFHVEFDDVINHIWRTCGINTLTAQIDFVDAELSFDEGIIGMGGILMPPPLDITIGLIRGDVDCDGDVDIFDLRTVAAFYDQSGPIKYDLNCDSTIDIFDLVIIATNFGYT